MNAKRRGLGRGLDALLGGMREHHHDGEDVAVGALDRSAVGAPVTHLPVDLIRRGRYQPRRDFDPDSLRELADSIAAQGVIQPIVVRPVGDGHYEIIAGERRWRAAQQAGLTEIPVVVREVDEQSAVAIGLIENIQRADLNPLEESAALNRLLHEFGLTHQQVAAAVGKSRTTVTNLLRLLELNDDVKGFVESRNLEMGHARCLLGLKGPRQSEAARAVVARGLSVRETERLVRRLQEEHQNETERRPRPELDPNIRRLLADLTDRLGARVEIHQGSKGAGKLLIAYNSLDELDGILGHIK
jgi:ParB family transcriptional regulator, chromosome partitioning protein